MNMEQIIKSYNNYKNVWVARELRRKEWAEVTRPLLKEILGGIAKAGIGMNLQSVEEMVNNETVSLNFNSMPSGYRTEKDGPLKHYIKVGGSMVFGSSGSGRVFVYTRMPFIDEIGTEQQYKIYKSDIEPKSITPKFIYELVDGFINQCISYEGAPDGKGEMMPIGFLADRNFD